MILTHEPFARMSKTEYATAFIQAVGQSRGLCDPARSTESATQTLSHRGEVPGHI